VFGGSSDTPAGEARPFLRRRRSARLRSARDRGPPWMANPGRGGNGCGRGEPPQGCPDAPIGLEACVSVGGWEPLPGWVAATALSPSGRPRGDARGVPDSVGHLKPGEDVGEAAASGLQADAQGVGDPLVAPTLGEKRQGLVLAAGESREDAALGRRVASAR
jgi:hypothetical protein